uniref:Si:ch211-120k19.1 n=1 Tax=Neolamprologus brichardi TaxID=32507 RepID=A0A3Q4G495_NEOBR
MYLLWRAFSKPGSTSEDLVGVDWHQTARVATVGFCFHANFNYHWLRGLEKMLPGGGVKAVTGKVVVDQLIAAPLTISAFYIGMLSWGIYCHSVNSTRCWKHFSDILVHIDTIPSHMLQIFQLLIHNESPIPLHPKGGHLSNLSWPRNQFEMI